MKEQEKHIGWRARLFDIIYHADTPAGKAFDIALIGTILISVVVVMLDSVPRINTRFHSILYGLEWFFTLLFTLEYVLRLVCTRNPVRYAFSFFGIIDLLAILPTYIGIFFEGTEYLLVLRSLRVLRIFRILRLVRFVGEADLLIRSLVASRHKITVFLLFMTTIVMIFGSLMYLIEGPKHGFTSIPESVYWAIITVTTVGYGDIAPQTAIGRMLASIMVILGYAIIAVPTGILTAELHMQTKTAQARYLKRCTVCGHRSTESKARYCSQCGAELEVK